jgi:hypothetical protein
VLTAALLAGTARGGAADRRGCRAASLATARATLTARRTASRQHRHRRTTGGRSCGARRRPHLRARRRHRSARVTRRAEHRARHARLAARARRAAPDPPSDAARRGPACSTGGSPTGVPARLLALRTAGVVCRRHCRCRRRPGQTRGHGRSVAPPRGMGRRKRAAATGRLRRGAAPRLARAAASSSSSSKPLLLMGTRATRAAGGGAAGVMMRRRSRWTSTTSRTATG